MDGQWAMFETRLLLLGLTVTDEALAQIYEALERDASRSLGSPSVAADQGREEGLSSVDRALVNTLEEVISDHQPISEHTMAISRGYQPGARGKNGRTLSDRLAPNEQAVGSTPQAFTPIVAGASTGRRHRGFQPAEVNKLKSGVNTQLPTNSVIIPKLNLPADAETSPEADDTYTNGLTSTAVTGSTSEGFLKASSAQPTQTPAVADSQKVMEPPSTKAPSAKTPVHSHKVTATQLSHSQTAAVDASQSKFDAVVSAVTTGGESSPSRPSSVKVITDDEPQSWTRPPIPNKSTTKVGWDNSENEIDKPIKQRNYFTPGLHNVPKYISPFQNTSVGPKEKKVETTPNLKKTGANKAESASSFDRQFPNNPRPNQPVPTSSTNKVQLGDNIQAHLPESGVTATIPPQKVTSHVKSEMDAIPVPPHLRPKVATATATASKGLHKTEEQNVIVPPQSSTQHKASRIGSQEKANGTEGSTGASAREEFNSDEQITAALQDTVADTATSKPKQITPKLTQKSQANIDQIPPHRRAQEPKLPVVGTKPHAKSSKPPGGASAAQNQSSAVSTMVKQDNPLKDITKSRQNVPTNVASGGAAVSASKESTLRKANNPVDRPNPLSHPSGLMGWDGKLGPAPVGDEWTYRGQHDPKGEDRRAVVASWRENHPAASETEVPGGEEDLSTTIDPPPTIPNPDDFNIAKRHLRAEDAIKALEKKRDAENVLKSEDYLAMNKVQKREFRRLNRMYGDTEKRPRNEHAPAANIYLRPAEMMDMRQLTSIHNHYIVESGITQELEENDEIYWRTRFQESYDEGNSFLVAVHKAPKSTKDLQQKCTENIVGFAFSSDYGLKKSIFQYTVELELWVHHDYLHQGIGRSMLDRMLGAMDPTYSILDCAPLIGKYIPTRWMGGGHRIIKTILTNLYYTDGNAKNAEWKKKWLINNDFQQGTDVLNIGFKFGKPIKHCQMFYTTGSSLMHGVQREEEYM